VHSCNLEHHQKSALPLGPTILLDFRLRSSHVAPQLQEPQSRRHMVTARVTGLLFTIMSRAGDLMEDANYFSRLGEDIHSDPLMTDYLSFQRQLYDDNSPAKGEVNDQNTPGRCSKRPRIAEDKDQAGSHNRATIDFTNIDWHSYAPVDITPEHEVDRQLLNLPIQFMETGILQSASRLNFLYGDTAISIPPQFFVHGYHHPIAPQVFMLHSPARTRPFFGAKPPNGYTI
jgi:hypothetical protein